MCPEGNQLINYLLVRDCSNSNSLLPSNLCHLQTRTVRQDFDKSCFSQRIRSEIRWFRFCSSHENRKYWESPVNAYSIKFMPLTQRERGPWLRHKPGSDWTTEPVWYKNWTCNYIDQHKIQDTCFSLLLAPYVIWKWSYEVVTLIACSKNVKNYSHDVLTNFISSSWRVTAHAKSCVLLVSQLSVPLDSGFAAVATGRVFLFMLAFLSTYCTPAQPSFLHHRHLEPTYQIWICQE